MQSKWRRALETDWLDWMYTVGMTMMVFFAYLFGRTDNYGWALLISIGAFVATMPWVVIRNRLRKAKEGR
jgi:hypothetical protein